MNDWILKQAVGGWWTGKLSDFAGLFAAPLFLSAVFPRRTRAIFALTAVGFLFWKSPLSGPALAAWNASGLWPLSRVVDYTDWIALGVLFPSHRLAKHPRTETFGNDGRWRRRLAAVTVALVAILAFTATSRAPPGYDVPPQEALYVGAPRSQVGNTLQAFGWWRDPTRRKPSALPDTLGGGFKASPTEWISLSIELRDAPRCGTLIMPLRMRSWRTPDFRVIRERFVEVVMKPLRELLPAC